MQNLSEKNQEERGKCSIMIKHGFPNFKWISKKGSKICIEVIGSALGNSEKLSTPWITVGDFVWNIDHIFNIEILDDYYIYLKILEQTKENTLIECGIGLLSFYFYSFLFYFYLFYFYLFLFIFIYFYFYYLFLFIFIYFYLFLFIFIFFYLFLFFFIYFFYFFLFYFFLFTFIYFYLSNLSNLYYLFL